VREPDEPKVRDELLAPSGRTELVEPPDSGDTVTPAEALPEAERHDTFDLTTELAVATDAARRAGRLQVEHYERLERIVHKGPRDVVTEVDQLSEELILSSIRGLFPQDALLAEESGAHRSPEGADPTAGTGRVWIIDPLDGTVNYANGIPIFCVSIGLAIDGRPALGVVYDPVRDELFSALSGDGARLDGEPIHHPAKEQLSDCVVSLAVPRRGFSARERKVRAAVRVTRVLGSATLALTYVANGRFDAFVQVQGLSSWDIAAGGLIASEGGATITDRSGGPWFDIGRATRTASTVAAAQPHHASLLELLK
jgi:myo-inositol-1(or 4)-monophosphatase